MAVESANELRNALDPAVESDNKQDCLTGVCLHNGFGRAS